jgi:hypothetical protein
MAQKFREWMEMRVQSEASSDWLTVERNPILKAVAENLAKQKEKLKERYGQKMADRIIAWTLAGGFVPLPGFQVALLLGLLGVSEIARAIRKEGEGPDPKEEIECKKVADDVGLAISTPENA